MYRKLIIFISLLSLLFTACGSGSPSASSDDITKSDVSESDSSASDKTNEESVTAAASDTPASEIDEGLRVVLAEIRDMVHPGEAGASLKSAQAAADALDFALGTELDPASISSMTQAYYASLTDAAAAAFPEQLRFTGEVVSALQSEEGMSLLEDAGITDSSYPWTGEAFAKVNAIINSI